MSQTALALTTCRDIAKARRILGAIACATFAAAAGPACAWAIFCGPAS